MHFFSSNHHKKKKPAEGVVDEDATTLSGSSATGTSIVGSYGWSLPAFAMGSDPSDLKSISPERLRAMRADVMVNWLHSKQEERIWTTGTPGEGIVLKVTKGQYVCCPSELRFDSSSLYDVIAMLNVRVSLLAES